MSQWTDWRFSARLAWQDFWFRLICLVALVLFILTTAFILFRLLPLGWRSGVIITHYNIYLGIDDVRSWPWIFFSPVLALVLAKIDVLVALGMYRRDRLASLSLLIVMLVSILLWATASFFLVLVNA